jgi:S1-C subfamily serine protease
MGSGFFVRSDGYVATTVGMVEGTNEILVEFDRHSYGARCTGKDPATNVAILHIQDPEFTGEHAARSISLGDGCLPATATFLMAITCEMGFDPSPALGLALGGEIRYGTTFFPTTYLRSSIPSNAGAPGSPVFDLNGQFMGMLMASIPAVDGSFILPAPAFRRVLNDLLFTGGVRYAYAGIHTQMRQDGQGNYRVTVDRIDANSPADYGKLRRGDRILSLNGLSLESLANLHDAIFFAVPESPLSLGIQRENEIFKLTLRTAVRPNAAADEP